MSDRRRLLVFAVLAAGCVLLSGAYVARAALRGETDAAGASASQLEAITSGPFVTFLTSTSGRNPYDELAVAPLANPDRRLLVGQRCDRVAMTGDVGICVRHSSRTLDAAFKNHYFDRSFTRVGSGRGSGIPSRARVSPSGKLAAVTSFRSGHSYDTSGAFSTQTVIYTARSGKPVVTLEAMNVFKDGKTFEPENRNFWGVTFAADDGVSSPRWARGSRRSSSAATSPTGPSGRCTRTSSPEGTRIAFKHREPDGMWRFAVLELATGRVTLLAEERSIDDQLAWADRDHLLYGGPGGVWSVRADGGGVPRLLLHDAVSPTVVR